MGAWLRNIGGRLRAILIIGLMLGVVLIDSVSRIISMCADGFLVLLIFALIWPLIKAPSTAKR